MEPNSRLLDHQQPLKKKLKGIKVALEKDMKAQRGDRCMAITVL
jgi:hypothetical protein